MSGHVRKRGDKWYYSFEAAPVDGQRRRVERVGGKTKAEAQRALREAITEYENAGATFEPKSISVADYFDYWLEEYVKMNLKHNTIVNYTNYIENHIKPIIGHYYLKSLTPAIMQKFINEKTKEGYSKSHLSGLQGVLTSALNYAVHPCEFMRDNPMIYVTPPKVKEKIQDNQDKVKVLSNNDIKNILKRFPENNTHYLPIMIGFHTGLRIGEIAGLTWDSINMKKKEISVKQGMIYKVSDWYLSTPKTKSSVRTIKMNQSLFNIIKRYKIKQKENMLKYGKYYKEYHINDKGMIYEVDKRVIKSIDENNKLKFVCTKENGEFYSPNTVKYLSRVINHQLGIDFNFHMLRHTHATNLLEAGVPIKYIQERLGHSRLATTMDTYSHVTESMEEKSMDIYEQSLSNLPTNLF